MKTYASFFHKFICMLLCIVAVALLMPAPSYAAAPEPPEIKSVSAALIEANTGRVLFEKDGSKQWPPASTTKILSAIIAIEAEDLDTEFTAGREVRFNSKSSLMGIEEGETVSLRDLLYGMMLSSGNDAAAMVGVAVGGSLEEFAGLMNAKAKELGMENSHFVNPHGLNHEQHYSTALDMAKVAAYAMKNESFAKIVGTETYKPKTPSKHKDNPLQLKTTNKLIYYDSERDDHDYRYRYATGVKTGSTPTAHGCLVASAKKDGVELIAVVFGDKTDKYTQRWEEVAEMFDYGFENFASVPLNALSVAKPPDAPISGAAPDASGNAVSSVPIDAPLGDQVVNGLKDQIQSLREDASPILVELHLDKDLVAPITKGQLLGTVSYRLDDDVLAIIDAKAGADVAAADAPPAPTVDLVSVGQTTRPPSGGPNPLLYVALALMVIVLAFLVLRILHVRKLRRARRKRLAMRRRSMGLSYPKPSDSARKRTAENRYYMYSRDRN